MKLKKRLVTIALILIVTFLSLYLFLPRGSKGKTVTLKENQAAKITSNGSGYNVEKISLSSSDSDPTYCLTSFAVPFFNASCGTPTSTCLLVDSDGDVWVGSLATGAQNDCPSVRKNSFTVLNESDVPVFSTNESHLYMCGSVYENQGAITAPANSFVVKNATGTTKFYITDIGDMYASGEVAGVDPGISDSVWSDQCGTDSCCFDDGTCSTCLV